MNLDKIDRDNMLRIVLAGRLSDLRAYAKHVIALEQSRKSATSTGRPVVDSLPVFTTPRRKPLPEMVVLDQAAIDDARDMLRRLEIGVDGADLDAQIWFRNNIPTPPPEPLTADGGWCQPNSPETV